MTSATRPASPRSISPPPPSACSSTAASRPHQSAKSSTPSGAPAQCTPETTPIRLASPASAAPPSAGSSGSRSAVAVIAAHTAQTRRPGRPAPVLEERPRQRDRQRDRRARRASRRGSARRGGRRNGPRGHCGSGSHACSTINRCGRLAQLVRAPALQAGGPRFEPGTAHSPKPPNHAELAPLRGYHRSSPRTEGIRREKRVPRVQRLRPAESRPAFSRKSMATAGIAPKSHRRRRTVTARWCDRRSWHPASPPRPNSVSDS